MPDMRVRVAMFLDLGSTYRSIVPAVTMTAESAWQAGPQRGEGMESWLDFSPGQTVRFSVDGIKVKALESADWQLVSAAVKKLQGGTDRPIAVVSEQAGGTVYEVYTGPYASADEASAAVTRVAQALAGQLGNQQPSIHGSFYYSAGVFGSKAEAQAYSQTLKLPGIEVKVAVVGANQYAVWVGGAVSEAALAALKAQIVQLQPQLNLSAIDAEAPALIAYRDVTGDMNSPIAVEHYAVSGTNTKLLVRDSEDSVIQVMERSGRKYRGNFEISSVNGQLALVNDVPLEQYLYSVVAAEVPSSWPQESLKAQAVAARSYALYHAAGNKFKVAGLVDTTLSQVYNGVDKEVDSIIQAVDSTAGEVIKANDRIVEAIFSSNSGGMTADSTEVWSNPNSTFSSMISNEDKAAQAGLKSWYHVLLPTGKAGYVREDNVKLTEGTTAAGLPKMTVTANATNVRPIPMIQADVSPVAQMNPGDQAVVLGLVDESSSYSWIRGPYSSEELLKSLKGKTATDAPSPILNLEITQRGPSGRATQIKANGQILDVRYPDLFRSAFGGLPSTLFDIAATGRYTVQSASGATSSGTAASGTPVLSSTGVSNWNGGSLVVMGADGAARVIDQSNRFLFVGRGNGHGLGLSQWGAKGMADAGYDYEAILQHYYQNVIIVKE
ncbi:SpoIID/LytB domain-containing protein [Paenibacillus lentus]|uniref:SpoIID/LytB domain-containing protein n=2 Tax=Paenibacillus lentus TaxID=1338368 RepID=A0A3Q8S7J7_9BACL|nr:SpoIID/LytB domain-containing protein [Paenibacillus lentus]